MSAPKYTPGPWQYYKTASGFYEIRGPNGVILASGFLEKDAPIAALAPEMLDALEVAAVFAETISDYHKRHDDKDGAYIARELAAEWRAILAKINGGA